MILEKIKIEPREIAKTFNDKKYGMKIGRAAKAAIEELEQEGIVILDKSTFLETAYFISKEAAENDIENSSDFFRLFEYRGEYLRVETSSFKIIPFGVI